MTTKTSDSPSITSRGWKLLKDLAQAADYDHSHELTVRISALHEELARATSRIEQLEDTRAQDVARPGGAT